jgi:hypothetical protein
VNEEICSGKLNGIITAFSTGANTLVYNSIGNNYSEASNSDIELIPMKAQIQTLAGPYSFDPKDGIAISSSITTLNQTINAGLQYKEITVTDTSTFINEECYLIFGFGTEYQTSPVKCLGVISSDKLLIDYGFVFPNDIPINYSVIRIEQSGGYVPTDVNEINAFYLTASTEGRVAAQNSIENIAAQGIPLNIEVRYPGDRGLGNEGQPVNGTSKIADKIAIWGGDNVDETIKNARSTK